MENPYQSPDAEGSGPTGRTRLIGPFMACLAVPLVGEMAVLYNAKELPYFLGLVQQSAGFAAFFWPVSLPLLFWFTAAMNAFLERPEPADLRFLWLVPVLVLPITALAWAALHRAPRPFSFDERDLRVLQFLIWGAFAFAGGAILANRGQRSLVASIALLGTLFAFGCLFTGGMCITGDWI